MTSAEGPYSGRGMTLGGVSETSITVALDGYAAGKTASGCIFQGTLQPHRGVNAYDDVSVTFGAAPCTHPNATVTGNACSTAGAFSSRCRVPTARTCFSSMAGNRCRLAPFAAKKSIHSWLT